MPPVQVMKIPMKKGEEEVESPEEDEAITGEASTNDFTDDEATFTDDGATTDTSEAMQTPVKNLMNSFESMETTPVKDVLEDLEGMVVTPSTQPVQYGLEKFRKKTPSKLKRMPALEARQERLKHVVKDGHALKKAVGRPSNKEEAIDEARKRGELMIVATLGQFNAAVKKQAEEMKIVMKGHCFAEKGGRADSVGWKKDLKVIVGLGSPDLQSNRRRHGVASARKDESACTKLKIAEHMKEMKTRHASEVDWKKECVKTYGRKWVTLKKILDGEAEWKQRMKNLKLGYGSAGTTAAKGTWQMVEERRHWSKKVWSRKEGQVQACEDAGEGVPGERAK